MINTILFIKKIITPCTYLHKINPQVFVDQKVKSHHLKEITVNDYIKFISLKPQLKTLPALREINTLFPWLPRASLYVHDIVHI